MSDIKLVLVRQIAFKWKDVDHPIISTGNTSHIYVAYSGIISELDIEFCCIVHARQLIVKLDPLLYQPACEPTYIYQLVSKHLTHIISSNYIHAKPLHKHDIVSVHFNHFYCMEICKEGCSYVHLHISQCRWVVINILYVTATV